jgi:anti-sigma factor RsiW
MILGCLGLATAAMPAHAQVRCPEGRTASGECVNRALAQAVRKQAVVLTQAKLSCVASPVMPHQDRDYYVIHQYPQVFHLFMPVPRVIQTRPSAC